VVQDKFIANDPYIAVHCCCSQSAHMRRKLIYEPIQNRQNTEIAVVAVQRQLLHVFTRSLARANTRHCSSFRPIRLA